MPPPGIPAQPSALVRLPAHAALYLFLCVLSLSGATELIFLVVTVSPLPLRLCFCWTKSFTISLAFAAPLLTLCLCTCFYPVPEISFSFYFTWKMTDFFQDEVKYCFFGDAFPVFPPQLASLTPVFLSVCSSPFMPVYVSVSPTGLEAPWRRQQRLPCFCFFCAQQHFFAFGGCLENACWMNDWFLLQLPCGGLMVGFPVDPVCSGLRALRIIADFLRRGRGKNNSTCKNLIRLKK